MSVQSEAMPAATSLDVTRCPRCLYDRRMQKPDEPCPECGHVMPEGVVVLTIPRQPRGWAAIASQLFWVAVLGGFVAVYFRSGIMVYGIVLVLLIQRVLQEAMRAYRIWLSEDAYVAQLWLCDKGMCLVPDADPDGMGRGVEAAVTWLTSLSIFAIVWLQDPSRWQMIVGVVAVVMLITWLPKLARWRRRIAPTPSTPPMTAWVDLKPVEITTRGDRVQFKTETARGNVATWRFSIVGDRTVAAELTDLVRRFAGTRHVAKMRG